MRFVTIVLLALLIAAPLAAAAKVYVCPMAVHTQEFDKPGACPICGMKLVEKDARFSVAVLVFNYAEDIDFTAPIEVLGHTGAEIFTVGATKDPITTVFGLHITPDYDIDHAPDAKLILIPGGGVADTAKNERVISWIRDRAAKAKYVMSVCNGAFILANTGLLDGLKATTTAGRIDQLATEYPKITVLRQRVVDNGKIMTAGGLSSGIDGALHVIEREFGRTEAEHIARGIEYRWDPQSTWSRAALADLRLPDIRLPGDVDWKARVDKGDTRQWQLSGLLQTTMDANAFLDYATKQITANGWKVRDSAPAKRTFVKKDREGQTWLATLESQPGDAGTIRESMSVRAVTE